MFRIRRYRLFLIIAIVASATVYHLSRVQEWNVPKVDGLTNFRPNFKFDATTPLPRPTAGPTLMASSHLQRFDTPSVLLSTSTVSSTSSIQTSALRLADVLKDTTSTQSEGLRTTTSVEKGLPTGLRKSRPPTAEEKQAAAQVSMEDFEQHGQGRFEVEPLPSAQPRPSWRPQLEHFPVPSGQMISLPTGTPKSLPTIQHTFSAESTAEKTDRLQKLSMIKEAFKHAWSGYKQHAMPHDELKPVSGEHADPFNGWGATLVDSLDTIWIMGLKEEFDAAVELVKLIDFTTSPRKDIPLFETTIRYLGGLISAYDLSSGQYPVLLNKAIELGEILMGAFDTPNRMPVAYYNWAPSYASQPHRSNARMVMAELGSLSMEFTRLAQITKKEKYYDAVARITDALEAWQMQTSLPGLWPLKLDASGCKKPQHDVELALPVSQDFFGLETRQNSLESKLERRQLDDASSGMADVGKAEGDGPNPALLDEASQLQQRPKPQDGIDSDVDCEPQGLADEPHAKRQMFGIGGQADSTYEYLPKEYLLLGGLRDQYRTMYEKAATAIKEDLLFRPMTKQGKDILFAGKLELSTKTNSHYEHRMIYEASHLGCFAGGMFALGAKVFGLAEDLTIAKKLTEGCIWAYESTVTGIMPEAFWVLPCESRHQCEWNETRWHEALDPNHQQRIEAANMWNDKRAAYLKNSRKQTQDMQGDSVNGNLKPTETTGLPFPDLPEHNTLRKRQLSDLDGPPPNSDIKRPPLETPSRTTSLDTAEPAPPSPATFVFEPKIPLSHEDFVAARIQEERLSPGFTTIKSPEYSLRPEAVESLFIMYRLTGEDYWRQKAWEMFNAIQGFTWTEIANSAISDVTSAIPVFKDTMESFWLAETLKYFFLLFSEPDVISLDEYVLNTEAHPFKRPT